MTPKIARTGSPTLKISGSLHNLPKMTQKSGNPRKQDFAQFETPENGRSMPAYLNCDEGEEGDEGRNINMRSSKYPPPPPPWIYL